MTNTPDMQIEELRVLGKRRREILNSLLETFRLFRKKRIFDAREYKILKLRFGERKTLNAIAQVFGVTTERIRQLEAKILEKIRDEYDK